MWEKCNQKSEGDYGCGNCPVEASLERQGMEIINSCHRLGTGQYCGPPSEEDGVEYRQPAVSLDSAIKSQKRSRTMSHEIDYSIIPEHCRSGMRLYIERGIIPGKFLQAVIKDQLVEFFVKADDINMSRAYDYARFMYNECPTVARGSEKAMNAWAEKGGLNGIREQMISDLEEKHAMEDDFSGNDPAQSNETPDDHNGV